MDIRKVKFVGFGADEDVRKQLIFRLLSRHFLVELSECPDYVFFLSGGEHFRFNDKVKIVVQSENMVVDFNAYDYGVGFDHMSFGDRYLRCPLFARCKSFYNLLSAGDAHMTNEQLLNRKFCSFVVSHQAAGDPMRELFFKRLSRYKKVDSGGRWMNNVGGPVADKLLFCRGYKFNIAFENSASLGYTTEKIVDAYAANTIPIYYGNPKIDADFNTQSMVLVHSKDDIERAVEEVIELDTNDDAYLSKITQSPFIGECQEYEKRLEDFLCHILAQSPHVAIRRNRYGCQSVVERREALIHRLYYSVTNSWIYAKVRSVASALQRFRGCE